MDYEDHVMGWAELIAWEETMHEFYELDQERAARIWKKAEIAYADWAADMAEQEREETKTHDSQ